MTAVPIKDSDIWLSDEYCIFVYLYENKRWEVKKKEKAFGKTWYTIKRGSVSITLDSKKFNELFKEEADNARN